MGVPNCVVADDAPAAAGAGDPEAELKLVDPVCNCVPTVLVAVLVVVLVAVVGNPFTDTVSYKGLGSKATPVGQPYALVLNVNGLLEERGQPLKHPTVHGKPSGMW